MQHSLRQHADYQRVYKAARKQFAKQMAYFFAPRLGGPSVPQSLRGTGGGHSAPEIVGPRIGLTVPKALGNAVARNRIKRRMREAVRRALPLLNAPVDVVLHPRAAVLTLPTAVIEQEVASVFRAIQQRCDPVSSGAKTAPPAE